MNALFAFDDPAAGRRAHEHLIAPGLPRNDVTLQAPAPGEPARLADEADELATGGMVRSMQHLPEGLFDRDTVDEDTSAFTRPLQRGGAVLRVRAATPGRQAAVDTAVREIGCARRTGRSSPAAPRAPLPNRPGA